MGLFTQVAASAAVNKAVDLVTDAVKPVDSPAKSAQNGLKAAADLVEGAGQILDTAANTAAHVLKAPGELAKDVASYLRSQASSAAPTAAPPVEVKPAAVTATGPAAAPEKSLMARFKAFAGEAYNAAVDTATDIAETVSNGASKLYAAAKDLLEREKPTMAKAEQKLVAAALGEKPVEQTNMWLDCPPGTVVRFAPKVNGVAFPIEIVAGPNGFKIPMNQPAASPAAGQPQQLRAAFGSAQGPQPGVQPIAIGATGAQPAVQPAVAPSQQPASQLDPVQREMLNTIKQLQQLLSELERRFTPQQYAALQTVENHAPVVVAPQGVHASTPSGANGLSSFIADNWDTFRKGLEFLSMTSQPLTWLARQYSVEKAKVQTPGQEAKPGVILLPAKLQNYDASKTLV